jgi:hypothetical protein
MSDQLAEVSAEIEIAAFLPHIPRRASIKARVVLAYVAVYGDNDKVIVRDVRRHLGNRVLSLVVVLERVAIAVPVEVVDDRVPLRARLVRRRKQDSIIARVSEDF